MENPYHTIYYEGTPVYIDTFAGLLRGIVTKIEPPTYWEPGAPEHSVTVKITTRNNRTYKRDELMELPNGALCLIPRAACIIRRTAYRTTITVTHLYTFEPRPRINQ